MRSVSLRKTGMAAIALVFAIAALFFAYNYLPWDAHAPIGLWLTGAVVIAAAEFTPIHLGSSRFRFRMAAQLPLAMLIGLWPVLALQAAIMAIRQFMHYVSSRSFTLHVPKFIVTLLLPCCAMTWFDLWQAYLPGSRLHASLILLSAICVYSLLVIGMQRFTVDRLVRHRGQALRGGLPAFLLVDTVMTISAAVQSAVGHVLIQVMIGLQLIVLMLAVAVYADSTLQRRRLVKLPTLLEVLTEDTSADKLAEHLFEGVAELLPVDVIELWRRDSHMRLTCSHRMDFAQNPTMESTQGLPTPAPTVQQGEGLVGFCASSREVVTVRSSRQPVVFVWNIDRAEYKSAMAVPIFDGGQVKAVLALYCRQSPLVYRKRDVEVMNVLGSQFGQLYYSLRRLELTRVQSETDELTGLYNYRYFDQALHECVRESDETDQPVSLLILDIDHFKKINDTHGHLAGNEVLQQLADVFRELLREDDIIARYGGEEFTILLPGLDQDTAAIIAERIRRRIEEMVFRVQSDLVQSTADEVAIAQTADGDAALDKASAREPSHGPAGIDRHLIQLTVSIGVATYPTNAESALTLIRHADRAMYVGSKQSGRNRVTVYAGAE